MDTFATMFNNLSASEDGRGARDGEEDPKEKVESFRKLCEHYIRGCSFVSPCCGKVYPCRVCHNQAELTHEIDRHAITEIVCRKCDTRQPVSESCNSCSLKFAWYFCPTCRLYDDTEKGQYHCDKCGICRVGGRSSFFHCDRCGLCLSISLKESHGCRMDASRNNCPVCMEDIHTARDAAHVPKCGHLLHGACYQQMLKNGLYQCPQCYCSLVDMSPNWQRLDEERDAWQMPLHLRNFNVKIKCRDCQEESETTFHIIGLKCSKCNSYNTVRCGNEEIPEDNGQGAINIFQHLFGLALAAEEEDESSDDESNNAVDEAGSIDLFSDSASDVHSEDEEESAPGGAEGEGAPGGAEGKSAPGGAEGEIARHSEGSYEDESESDNDSESLESGSISSEGEALPFLIFNEPAWYGNEEADWPHQQSDWSNSDQSDNSWETEEEEVVIGEEADQSSEDVGQQLPSTTQNLDDASDAGHDRVDQDGTDDSNAWESANEDVR